MKLALIAFFSLVFATPAFARTIPEVCEANAAKFTERSRAYLEFYAGRFDSTEIMFGYDCQFSADGRAVNCEVGVSKGNGDATDTWQTTMDASCLRFYRAILIGEE